MAARHSQEAWRQAARWQDLSGQRFPGGNRGQVRAALVYLRTVATRMKPGQKNVLYLYGISEGQVPPPSLAGVDGAATIEAVPCAGLVCWISRVAASDFADNLARNMENLDWLAEVGVRHQRAVAAVAELCDVLPARFGTVFLSESTLAADVRSRKPTLLADLQRIRG